MLSLKRRLYQLILRLHPAAFRTRFAREMSLDFEDALATYGFSRLLADATRSLVRQWTTVPVNFAFARASDGLISQHPLLSGQYIAIDDDHLGPFELARGTALFIVLAVAIGFAFGAGGRRLVPAIQQALPASHDGGLGVDSGHPYHPSNAAGVPRREHYPDYSKVLAIPAPYSYSREGLPARFRSGHTIYGKPKGRIERIRMESWTEFLTRCALITAIVWVVSLLFRRSRTIPVRVALTALGFLGVVASAAGLSICVPPVRAQLLHSDGPLPSFEVATVKPRDPHAKLFITPPGSQQIVTQAGTAKTLISAAYGVRPARVVGGPAWVDDSHNIYVIEGKIPQEVFVRMQSMTADQRREQASLMLQSLLAARFGLKAHIESREMPVYELTLVKSGAKLPAPNDETPSRVTPDSDAAAHRTQMGGGETIGKDGVRVMNMTLNGMLEPPWFDLGDRPILNKTGLTGKYNLTINWLPNIAAQRGPGTEIAAPEGQASIFTALDEQFGLKLVPARAPVEILVIDSIEKPSEN